MPGRTALGTDDVGALMQDELAADKAFQADTARQRQKLLLERPMESCKRHVSVLKTPVTLPSTCT